MDLVLEFCIERTDLVVYLLGDAFCAAIDDMLSDMDELRTMGERGRQWVVEHASPAAVGEAYEAVLAPDR